MSYRIEIAREALKHLAKVDRPIRRRIQAAIEGLADEPRPPGMIALKGVPAFRIRVGDYRVIYSVDDGRLLVLVIEVGHRREVYG